MWYKHDHGYSREVDKYRYTQEDSVTPRQAKDPKPHRAFSVEQALISRVLFHLR